jgi:dihydropteroate synthase
VSAGLADEAMARIAAETGAQYVAMHWRGHSDRMDELTEYADVARDVRDELAFRVDALLAAGIAPDRLILDPGLGFSKRGEQNWELLPDGAPVEQRDLPTAVVSALSAQAGAWGVRVHDVVSTRVALDVARAWQSGRRAHHS